jgi:hypothetical protein
MSLVCGIYGRRQGAALPDAWRSHIHFHLLLLDGAYRTEGVGAPVFRPVSEPRAQELQALVEQIAERVGGLLKRGGLVERDMENAWLAGDGEADPLDDLIGHSITYRIAVGPRAGQKLFTLSVSSRTVPLKRSTIPLDSGCRGRVLMSIRLCAFTTAATSRLTNSLP